MRNLRLFAALFITFQGLPQSSSAGCLELLLGRSDEISRASVTVLDRVQRHFPGEAVSVVTSKGSSIGFVIRNSIDGMALLSPEEKIIPLKAKEIQAIRRVQLGDFPHPEHLEQLKRLHSLRTKQAELDTPAIWKKVQPQLSAEIAQFRKLNRTEQENYLSRTGDEVIAKVKQVHHTDNIGFHYNLNGGYVNDYAESGGIRISKGDIALAYGSGDSNYKVFFFQSNRHSLYDVLNQTNPKLPFFSSGRMGSTLIAFKLDGQFIQNAKAEGGIIGESGISFDFSEEWVRKQSPYESEIVGIAASEFIAPPTVVFEHLKLRVGMGSLSRNEETLATMRYLEHLWTRP